MLPRLSLELTLKVLLNFHCKGEHSLANGNKNYHVFYLRKKMAFNTNILFKFVKRFQFKCIYFTVNMINPISMNRNRGNYS